MGKACSDDLRRHVVDAVIVEGMSRHAAAARFGVAPSSAVKWVQRFRRTGSVSPKVPDRQRGSALDAHPACILARVEAEPLARLKAGPHLALHRLAEALTGGVCRIA